MSLERAQFAAQAVTFSSLAFILQICSINSAYLPGFLAGSALSGLALDAVTGRIDRKLSVFCYMALEFIPMAFSGDLVFGILDIFVPLAGE
jgi:hypothetical protein